MYLELLHEDISEDEEEEKEEITQRKASNRRPQVKKNWKALMKKKTFMISSLTGMLGLFPSQDGGGERTS